MNLERKFKIMNDDGTFVLANVIVTFEYLDQHYCIYGIPVEDKVNIYCAKNIDGDLIKIVNKEEEVFFNTIVNKLIDAVKLG